MKQYSMIQAPVLAFFSKELYRDVGRNWRARSFVYLLLLVAACWIPEALEMQTRMTRFALIAPVLILGSYVLKIAQALLYAIVGILIAKNVDADLGYGALVSLAMVALTPAIVAKTLMSLVDVQTGGLLMIIVFVAGSIFYLGYGIHACAHPSRERQPSGSAPPTPPGN